ncbi:MAG: hypothetical protein A2W01_10140 [Candidatus Solincola sediminis]|uniref:Zinc-ribbon domain-containing protein n=1 Tax=Candidatus Solincola sediminis TaxID=1797199 RepID=A0A1F2WGX4_9ACTN|nr:MAG: hypothetical protein A2Y75_00795 [Candidatus Solincola sediminis]OFW56623.1 MAG: hypothetical protein A2W01_10140 [Candidatus Solincola sediminis]
MDCPECGKSINTGSSFCPYCGADVMAMQGGSDNMPPQPTGGPPQPPPTPASPQPPPGPAAGPPQPPFPTPGPPSAPPGYTPGMPPAAPVKKGIGRGWKIAIIVIIVGVLVVGALAAVLGIFVFTTVKKPVDVTNRFIEAINAGRAQEAWDLLTSDSRVRLENDFNSFREDLVTPSVGSLDTWNAHEVNVSGSRAEVTVDMDFSDGSREEFIFELRKTGDEWLIYDYTYREATP